MTEKDNNIKSMIELRIANIGELGSMFVRYKAKSIKKLLEKYIRIYRAKRRRMRKAKRRK